MAGRRALPEARFTMGCRRTVSSPRPRPQLTADALNVAAGSEKLLATIFPDMIGRRGGVRGSADRITAMVGAMNALQVNHDLTNYGLLLHRALNRAVGS